MSKINFTDKNGSFEIKGFEGLNGFYFPLASETGLKTAVTPQLGGDSKLDQNHFLFEPTSIENLNNNKSTRNFWVMSEGEKPWSVTGLSAHQKALLFTDNNEEVDFAGGFMWQEMKRTSLSGKLQGKITSFVPRNINSEIHIVEITNNGDKAVDITMIAALPIYGRSADNLRDHRHVTSLLHRISVMDDGVLVNPTLSFDERGHQLNDTSYFVRGFDGEGNKPESFYPVLDDFYGENGDLEAPDAIIGDLDGVKPGFTVDGQEALGGLRFAQKSVLPGEKASYIVFCGIGECELPGSLSEVENLLKDTKEYWENKVNVSVSTKDSDFDGFMKWISFQPELRRIFGCSFLPHHDYGRGGRGWRDLWQDCLALLVMNPDGVRDMLLSNFLGVRTNGTNATIIGEKQGEFKADRNGIARIWMDHGMWPLMTVILYLNQTGDYNFLMEKGGYFEESRYQGTALEHLILENLRGFWDVGEHNHSRLRGADWNDALDMAAGRGESVAFTNAYGKNLIDLADILVKLDKLGTKTVEIFEELSQLLEGSTAEYDDYGKKIARLADYETRVSSGLSGKTLSVSSLELAKNLREKGMWIREHVRASEWIDAGELGWYNGYYDNDGQPLEKYDDSHADIMLTSQVFSVMSGTATEEQIEKICKAADKYLYDEECGGYRLNTNFNEIKTNMGRMFGFAYGEKENGAVFSHMAVMYANALYSRGFAKEGYKALNSLYARAMDFENSRIFPGIPEYFGRGGKGLYHYLTGAASWYMLTVVQEVFGIKPIDGKLTFEPKLMKEQFNAEGIASISLVFHGKPVTVKYINSEHLDFGCYVVKEISENDGVYTVILGE